MSKSFFFIQHCKLALWSRAAQRKMVKERHMEACEDKAGVN